MCLNYTADDVRRAGGVDKLYVAYYDASISTCDNDWNRDGAGGVSVCHNPVKGAWYPLPTTYRATANGGGEACANLYLTATFGLVIMDAAR